MTRPTELHTQRLHLRPFRADDVADALAYRNDPEFARFLPHIPQPFTQADAEAFVALNMSESWDTSPVFAVTLPGTTCTRATLIGTVNFEINIANRSAMIGYAIGRRWWACGYAPEAARAAMAWAIETYSLTRIWAGADVRHVRSQRVLEKLGLHPETTRPSGHPGHPGRDGAMVDEVVCGIDIRNAN